MSTPIFNTIPNSTELEAMVYDIAVRAGIFVPVNKNSVKYKNYLIIKDPDSQWNVFHVSSNTPIATTFLKISAFAICKLHETRHSKSIKEVQLEDDKFRANYLDSVFHKNTYTVSKDAATRDTAQWRYEIVKQRATKSKERIDRIFYSLIDKY